MKRGLSVGAWLGLLGVTAQLGAAEPTPAERAEAAAERLRDEAAKAEAALPEARAKLDEARAKAEAARPTAQSKVDPCLAKVDADEAAWKGRLERCEEQATASEACVSRYLAGFHSHGSAVLSCLSEACASLRKRGDGFEPRREACRKPLEAVDRPLREAEARVSGLEGDARRKKALAELMTKLATTAPAAMVDAVASGRMLMVPSGKVTLGETKQTFDVAAFLLDRAEVTVAAYAACVKAGKCTPAKTGGLCNAGVAGREQHPINCVDWNQADAYCKAQGLRLPTEEEWEYAATGGDGRTYPWGNAAPSDQLCWDGKGNDQGERNRRSTCPVGSHPKGRSPFDLDDMSGNVWEWTSTQEGSARVSRGGGWGLVDPSHVRSANRVRLGPTDRDVNLGFRCAGSAALP